MQKLKDYVENISVVIGVGMIALAALFVASQILGFIAEVIVNG